MVCLEKVLRPMSSFGRESLSNGGWHLQGESTFLLLNNPWVNVSRLMTDSWSPARVLLSIRDQDYKQHLHLGHELSVE